MLFAAVALVLIYWWVLWPRLVSLLFHSNVKRPLLSSILQVAQRNVAALIFASALILALATAGLLDVGGADRGLQTQATALGVSAAATFAYATLIPPVASVMTHWVTDRVTGDYDDTHLAELRLVPGAVTPVFMGLFNAGLMTWHDYRITIELPSGFVAMPESDDYPDSKKWKWAGGSVNSVSESIAQVIRTAPLASGEPQIARFFVRSPAVIPGDARVQIVIASAGRLGEARCSLRINPAPLLPWSARAVEIDARA